MLDYRSMTDDELYFPQLFANSERQARFLADTEPPIDHDGDTAKLELPPAPLYDLADDDWPAMEVEPDDRVAHDKDDGYTDDDPLPFEE